MKGEPSHDGSTFCVPGQLQPQFLPALKEAHSVLSHWVTSGVQQPTLMLFSVQ